MKTLSNSDVSFMESLVGVTQETLKSVLYHFLQRYYKNVTCTEDFVIAEGDIPIALAAHMDTVFKKPAEELYYDRKKNVMWSPTGMGADDRAGIFAIIQIIKAGYKPHVIFTTDEEIGGVGAQELALHPCPFKDLRYIVQIDRRNANDCVFYECDNPEFEKYIEGFGFVTAWGTFTDICELCPSWGCAGVNLSIGYRDEHSISEVLFVGQMLDTIEKIKKMLSQSNIPYFKYIPAYDYYSWYDYYSPTERGFYPPKDTIRYKCHKCGKSFKEDDVLDVKLIKGGRGYFCVDCLLGNTDWCHYCGDVFEIDPDHPHDVLCSTCKKKVKK